MKKIAQDKSVIICKGCNETKTRYLDGKYPNAKDKKWLDENGKQFNGHLCPGCQSRKVAQRKRLKSKNSYV